MPTELERFYGKHDLHFLTFSCYRRLQLLSASIRFKPLFVLLSTKRDPRLPRSQRPNIASCLTNRTAPP